MQYFHPSFPHSLSPSPITQDPPPPPPTYSGACWGKGWDWMCVEKHECIWIGLDTMPDRRKLLGIDILRLTLWHLVPFTVLLRPFVSLWMLNISLLCLPWISELHPSHFDYSTPWLSWPICLPRFLLHFNPFGCLMSLAVLAIPFLLLFATLALQAAPAPLAVWELTPSACSGSPFGCLP